MKKKDLLVLHTDLLLDRDQTMALRDIAIEQFSGAKVAILTAGLMPVILRGIKR